MHDLVSEDHYKLFAMTVWLSNTGAEICPSKSTSSAIYSIYVCMDKCYFQLVQLLHSELFLQCTCMYIKFKILYVSSQAATFDGGTMIQTCLCCDHFSLFTAGVSSRSVGHHDQIH